MKQIVLTLPGLKPGEVFAKSLSNKRDLPYILDVTAEPWDTIVIDPMDDPIKILKMYSPKKKPPTKLLLNFNDGDLKIGYGAKVIVPAMPASGKTTFLRKLGEKILQTKAGIITNILVDERPEEKLAGSNARTINLSYMRSANDILIGLLSAISDAMIRVIQNKSHEVIFIDSLTRLVEVANSVILHNDPSQPVGTGGVTLASRRFVRTILGLGNAFTKGGSLTIIGTTLVGGSSLEDIIYKDLKGVSNAEIFLNYNKKTNKNKYDLGSVINYKKSYSRNSDKIR